MAGSVYTHWYRIECYRYIYIYWKSTVRFELCKNLIILHWAVEKNINRIIVQWCDLKKVRTLLKIQLEWL